MSILPKISPACREELERAGFRAGVAYMEVPGPLQIRRPAGEPMTYDPNADRLTIGDIQFCPQFIEDFVQAARANHVGPVLLKIEADRLVVTKPQPAAPQEQDIANVARIGGSRWIPVSEQLPGDAAPHKNRDALLVRLAEGPPSDSGRRRPVVELAGFFPHDLLGPWVRFRDGEPLTGVTHWMPIPPFPETET